MSKAITREEITDYLKQINFQKRIDKLAKKHQNKTIMLYGAGLLFDIIYNNYDLSKLNIVGIADQKFSAEKKEAFGYCAYHSLIFPEFKPDITLMALMDCNLAEEYFENYLYPSFGRFKTISFLNGKNSKNTKSLKTFIEKEIIYKINSILNGFKIKNIQKKVREQSQSKIHLGCGKNYIPGWINIDNRKITAYDLTDIDIEYDLTMPFPFEENSLDFVFNEHFIEHITYEEGLILLRNLHKSLKPGGVVRIACPDLRKTVENYLSGNWNREKFNWIRSSCHMLNVGLNYLYWEHKYVYDKEDLINSLKLAGFSEENIKEQTFANSDFPELQNIEVREDSMIFEAKK